MTPLERFLTAVDLDDALLARDELGPLSAQDRERISGVVTAWVDRQALANLLIYAELIPADLRFQALDRALHSSEVPYYRLAATVGLQNIELTEVPEEKRGRFVDALLGFLESTWSALAGRASVTLGGWALTDPSNELLRRILARYPVPDEWVSKNIAALMLARYGAFTEHDFARKLVEWDLPEKTRRELRKAHSEYYELKARDEFRARLMQGPSFSYIPNLSEVVDQQPPFWRRLLTWRRS